MSSLLNCMRLINFPSDLFVFAWQYKNLSPEPMAVSAAFSKQIGRVKRAVLGIIVRPEEVWTVSIFLGVQISEISE